MSGGLGPPLLPGLSPGTNLAWGLLVLSGHVPVCVLSPAGGLLGPWEMLALSLGDLGHVPLLPHASVFSEWGEVVRVY